MSELDIGPLVEMLRVSHPKPINARHSIAVRGTIGDQRVVLKVARTDKESAGIANEAKYLRERGDVFGRRYISDGMFEGCAWLAQKWISGPTLWDGTGIEGTWRYLYEVCKALAKVHSAGLVHGDVQPAHFVRDDADAWQVFDLGTVGVAGVDHYNGGMIHFMPSEVARMMLSGREIILNFSIDVYSWAATVYYVLTRQFPVDYEDAVGRDARLERIASNDIRTISVPDPTPTRVLEGVLKEILISSGRERPSIASVVERLDGVVRYVES